MPAKANDLIHIDDSIKGDEQLYSFVNLATQLITPLQESSRERVTIDWKREQDEYGRPVVELTLSDSVGAVVHERFATRELSDVQTFGHYVARLWSDLLRDRTHKHRDRLRKLVAELEESK